LENQYKIVVTVAHSANGRKAGLEPDKIEYPKLLPAKSLEDAETTGLFLFLESVFSMPGRLVLDYISEHELPTVKATLESGTEPVENPVPEPAFLRLMDGGLAEERSYRDNG